MKIILDFDDTIFNTKAFKKHIFEVLKSEGVYNGEEIYEEGKKRGELFALRSYLIKLGKEFLYEELIQYSKECVSKEMLDFLNKYGKDNCFIVTHGDEVFQREKILYSGIINMVNEVFVVAGSKMAIVEKIAKKFQDEKVIFIDNKEEFLKDIDCATNKNLLLIHYKDSTVSELIERINAFEKVV